MANECLFCNPRKSFAPNQILLEGQYFYLFAPKGQIIEGYIILAPYSCTTIRFQSLADTPSNYMAELLNFVNIIQLFFKTCYGIKHGVFFEHGRAGICLTYKHSWSDCYHAHLCCYPVDINLHDVLMKQYSARQIKDCSVIPMVAKDRRYLYLESVNAFGGVSRNIFYVSDDCVIERGFLRGMLADRLGCQERADWRTYPGEKEIASTSIRFSQFMKER